MSSREGSPTAPSPWIVAGGAIFVVAMLVAVTDVVRAGDAVEHTGGLGIAVLLTSGIGAAAGTIIAGAGLLLFALRKTKAPRVLTARAIPAGLIALGAWPMIDALTSGPWISSQAWVGVLRWGAVLLAFVGGCIGARLADLAREGADHRRRYLLAMSLACLALDILAFPNQYAAFHQGLAVAFVILAAMTGIGLAEHTRRIAVAVAPIGLVGGLIALGLVATDRLPGDDAAHRQFLRRDAPWCTRLLTLRPDAPTDVDIATGDVIARLLPTPDPVDPGVLDTMLPVRRDANIVFITLDAVRPDHLGCYGYVRRPSPELDAFAALCTVFERCWAQYPSSQLSLASMFQSLYPSATDVAGRRNQPNELQQPQSMPPLALRLRNAGRRTVAVSALKRRFVADIFPFLREGFDRFNEFPTPDNLDGTEVTKHTLDELRLLTGDQPWFLWSHYFDPHHPYRPHPDGPGFGGGVSGLYDGEIHHMDRQLGVALRALQKRDDWSRTIVVIHADHGEELLDHGGSYHNSSLYEEQVRVPLLIRIPGVSGHRVPSIVELVDVVPTLLELMGQEIPEGLQGHSLLRVILPQSLTNDGGQAPPAAGFTQFREPASLSPRQDAVCIGDDKLVHHISSDTYELFDLDQDEGEQKNRALQTTDTLEKMMTWLAACRGLARRRSDGVTAGGDEDLLGAVRTGTIDQRQRALYLLVQRRRHAEVAVALGELIAEGQPADHLKLALETLPLSPVDDVLPRLEALVGHEDPEVRQHAALAIAALDLDAAPVCLEKLEQDQDARGYVAGFLARGLLGDERVRPHLQRYVTDMTGKPRVLFDVALARLGDPAARARIGSILRYPDKVPTLFAWAARLLRRTGDPQMMFSLYGGFEHTTIVAWWRDPALLVDLTRGRPRPLVAPILRRSLALRGPRSRQLLLKALDGIASPWRGFGLQMLQSDGADKPLRAAEAFLGACRRSEKNGVTDWGLGYLAWRRLIRAGERERAARLLTEMNVPATTSPPEVRTFLERLGHLARSMTDAARVTLTFSHADHVINPGKRVVFIVRITLDAGGGGLGGGTGEPSPALFVNAVRDGKNRMLGAVSLPVRGILPGESCEVMLAVNAPDLVAGEYEIRATLSQKHAPRPVGESASVTRRVVSSR